jgi:hypothetical protein
MHVTWWFDNSADNLANSDPTVEARYGLRAVDEMMNAPLLLHQGRATGNRSRRCNSRIRTRLGSRPGTILLRRVCTVGYGIFKSTVRTTVEQYHFRTWEDMFCALNVIA